MSFPFSEDQPASLRSPISPRCAKKSHDFLYALPHPVAENVSFPFSEGRTAPFRSPISPRSAKKSHDFLYALPRAVAENVSFPFPEGQPASLRSPISPRCAKKSHDFLYALPRPVAENVRFRSPKAEPPPCALQSPHAPRRSLTTSATPCLAPFRSSDSPLCTEKSHAFFGSATRPH